MRKGCRKKAADNRNPGKFRKTREGVEVESIILKNSSLDTTYLNLILGKATITSS